MKRILHLIKGLGAGGAEQLLVTAASYVDRDRFHYEVAYLLPWKNALVPRLEESGIPVHCLDGRRGPGWISRLRKLVREREIDLVHSHSPVPAVGARIGLGRRGRIRRVYTEHNVWERYHRLTFWANALTYPRSDHVFAVSDHVRESVKYPLPLRGRRMPPVETVYHGIDLAAPLPHRAPDDIRRELGLPEASTLVGTVANFKAHKGYPVLLRAVARVRSEMPDVRFVLVGQGPLEDEMRRMARNMGLDGTVVFTGYRDDVLSIVSAFELFVLPSLYEGLSIALIEAMSLGKPAVVSNAGGLPEVLEDGKQGLIVEPGDAPELAAAIIRLLRQPSLREQFGNEARRRAAHFDIRKAVRRIEQVYSELLA